MAKASITCCNAVRDILVENEDKEFTTTQMTKKLHKVKKYYARSTVSVALKKLHDDDIAERIRNGNAEFRYSLANTN